MDDDVRGDGTAALLAYSARRSLTDAGELDDVRRWLAEVEHQAPMRVRRVSLDDLEMWETDPSTGDISHRSGGFFTVGGLRVRIPGQPVEEWWQPIIRQPEVGILGILVREEDGVLHCLMQAKAEPGNARTVQLSPTVQATRSNYTRVHGGRAVPYLEYFRDPSAHRVLVDVRQSEQGAWFHHKRNRNMVVQADSGVEVRPGFRWLPLGQVLGLLAEKDMVNMDARTVLSCLPFAREHGDPRPERRGDDPFLSALRRSCVRTEGALHSMVDVLSWITDARSRIEPRTAPAPLNALRGWRRAEGRISHESGLFFDVIGVSVEAGEREVTRWAQPMIEPHGQGVVAFLARPVDGVLHVLVHARVEAGYVDVVELAPTVQCTPQTYTHLPASARPRFLDEVLAARAERVRFDSVLSEEGGRFYHARNRYLIVETDADPAAVEWPDFRWMPLHQLAELLRHSHYVNIQARSLVACLYGLLGADTRE